MAIRRREVAMAASTTARGIGPGRGTHLVQNLEVRQRRPASLGGVPAAKLTDEVFGGSVVVGEVPGREAGIDVGGHASERLLAFDTAVGAGCLPHAVQHAADGEIGRERETL